MGNGSRVSVVIVTRSRRPSLLRTLSRLHELPGPPPVIVVDNDSDDGTASAVKVEWPTVKVVALPANMGSAGRNAGVAVAETPYVAFSDDDSWWDADALCRAVDLFDRHPRLALIAGRVVVEPRGEDDPLCSELARAPYGVTPAGPRAMGFLACGAVVRRAPFLAVGGFPLAYGVGGEEEIVALDLAASGWLSAYAPDVVAFHAPDSGVRREGRARRQLRNSLWTTWLRRSAPAAVALTTERLADRSLPVAVRRAALADAVRQSRWVATHRRPVPMWLEHRLRHPTPAVH